jgi:hypothetical protein
MTQARLDGLYMLLLGCVVFVLLGAAMENTAPEPLADFRGLYYPARCLIQHCDPYMESGVLRIFRQEGGDRPSDTAQVRQIATQAVYPPSAFCVSVPFAMMPWGLAHIVWITLTFGSLIFASFLIWNLGADYAPILSGVLVGFLLANSEVLIMTGNAAGIMVSLCVVAVWCFLRQRFVPAGILCLAVSLAVKPHDTGLVWMYFLLAGGVYRKRALQSLLATIVLSLPAVLWVWHVAPHWMQELHSNILAFSVHGGTNDPGLASGGAHGLAMVVSLQAMISVFWDDPRIYDWVSYLIFAPLLFVWMFATLRSRSSPAKTWLALAAISALSMLPVYHRLYDTKLLLLTVPACAMLWAEGGWIGKLALAVNAAGFVLTGDLPWAVVIALIQHLHLPATEIWKQALIAVQVFPAPLALLAMGSFYLWVYARHSSRLPGAAESGNGTEAPVRAARLDSGTYLNRPFRIMIPSSRAVGGRRRT